MPGTTSEFMGKSTEAGLSADWDSSQDSCQDWNRERGDSMKSGSRRSLASGASSKTDVTSETSGASGASGGPVETGKEAKETTTKKSTSWVKNIGMRTLRLRKNSDNSRSKLSLSSSGSMNNTNSLDRPIKSGKGKQNLSLNADENVDKEINASTIKSGSSTLTKQKPGGSSEHVKVKNSRSGGASSNGSAPGAIAGETPDKQDPARFIGEGMSFKAKLIGVLEVSGPRGDRICQEALSELKMAVKAAGEHKQKITIHIALDGLRIRDEKTGDCLYHHQVHKISFIAQDLTDARAFGYIFGSPDTGHRFFGIKTEKSASQVVIAMRDLFQVVFDLKKKEIERAKQQLEMQQKFLATRAAETAPNMRSDLKTTSIAEIYIEGACALGAQSSSRTDAPEVDLLNLEVELNSLQEGLDNIHNNLVDSVPFRGSTASISSDPMNPLPKFSNLSVSSSNTNNPTPVPALSNDPFGDSFDPFDAGAAVVSAVNVNVAASSNSNSAISSGKTMMGNHNSSSSCNNSGFTSPFTTDPFAQVDPFPGPKFGDGDFFTADPFDSPVTSFSFNFSNDGISAVGSNVNSAAKISENRFNSNSNQPTQSSEVHSSGLERCSQENPPKYNDGWAASFEDNFAPDSTGGPDGANGLFNKESSGSGSGLDIFTELDPLGTGRVRPFVDRKDFFQELKNPPKKVLKDLCPDMPSSPASHGGGSVEALSSTTTTQPSTLSPAMTAAAPSTKTKVQISDTIPNSFSTNFAPQPSTVDFDSHFKTSAGATNLRIRLPSENSRCDSPPNYSPPPPPPHQTTFHASSNNSIGGGNVGSVSNSEYFSSTPPILPPPSSSMGTPPIERINKKSPQLLKQMTISSTSPGFSSSPRTLPRSTRLGKQYTVDLPSSSGDGDIPNLTPPPRPPHASKNATLTTAVPRPLSGNERLRKISGCMVTSTTSLSAVPPEPPPRPIQTTTVSSTSSSASMKLVSPPPPLPPKKQTIGPTMSNPIISMVSGGKMFYNNESKNSNATPLTSTSSNPLRNTMSESNDLPLPLPSRKSHVHTHTQNSSSQNFSNTQNTQQATSGSRYGIPLVFSSVSASSMSALPTLGNKREEGDGKVNIHAPVVKLTMEQALNQVASLSLGELAFKLDLPVERLSSLTIQQLAEKLTLMDFEKKMEQREMEREELQQRKHHHHNHHHHHQLSHQERISSTSSAAEKFESGFEDDFSTASAPPGISTQKQSNFDKYAVFRELTVEDASGFSIVEKLGETLAEGDRESVNSEDEEHSKTLDKTLTVDKDSSSERTLQADSVSVNATINANTMDDITDANLSDDGKFPLDDEDDLSVASNFKANNEWATFESNFDDQFATDVLVKGEDGGDGEESPWESDEGGKSQKTPILLPPPPPRKESRDQSEFDFQPFQKPPQPAVSSGGASPCAGNVIPTSSRRRESREKDREQRHYDLEPDMVRSPGGQFKRQSSGSSRHSERSLVGSSMNVVGKNSDYSDSGRPNSHLRSRHNSQDVERWDLNRERDGSGRRDRDRDRDRVRLRDNYGRSESRNSYSSNPRKYQVEAPIGDSDDDYVPSNSLRHSRNRVSSGRKQMDRPNREDIDIEDEEDDDDRSYASYHSSYSTSHRKHRRYPQKYYHNYHGGTARSGRRVNSDVKPSSANMSPERYSNHESDFDDSIEEENGTTNSLSRKREYYLREREYLERHPRQRPVSSGPGKRYNRERDREFRDRQNRRRGPDRERDLDDDFDRELSDFSGEDPHSHASTHSHHHGHGHSHGGGPRRFRAKRSNPRDRDRERDSRHYYYTNSPSWDSESGPDGAEAGGNINKTVEKSRIGSASRYATSDELMAACAKEKDIRGQFNGGGSGRRSSAGYTASRFHHSDIPYGSKTGKLSEFRFDDDFAASSTAKSPKSPMSTKNVIRPSSEPTVPSSSRSPLSVASSSTTVRLHDFHGPEKGKSISNKMRTESINSISSTGNDGENKLTHLQRNQPQSPFEDNFVAPNISPPEKQLELSVNNSDKSESGPNVDVLEEEDDEKTEENEVLAPLHLSSRNIADKKITVEGDVFFPAKFEIEVEVALGNNNVDIEVGDIGGGGGGNNDQKVVPVTEVGVRGIPAPAASTPTSKTNSNINYTGNTKADGFVSNKRLESIRSEEEKVETNKNDEDTPLSMKKSDSFNIFQQAKDPFADDDFFA